MKYDLKFFIGATVITLALFYYFRQPTTNKHFKKNKIESEADLDMPANPQLRPKAESITSQTAVALKGLRASQLDQNPSDKETVYRQFSNHLKSIGQCLKLNVAPQTELVDPTYDNLLVTLRPMLGEVVVQMEDWSQIDLVTADGQKKRLRTEMNYDNPQMPVKTVQMFQLNDVGGTDVIPLDEEKALNPSEEYLQFLSAGMTSVFDEKSSRAFFQEGEEVVIVERGGRIESLSITKNGQTVSCTGLNVTASNCQCF